MFTLALRLCVTSENVYILDAIKDTINYRAVARNMLRMCMGNWI